MASFTYAEWEALWLLTMGQVEFSGNAINPLSFEACAGGENITPRFDKLKDLGFITIHRPGWLNGNPTSWRIEITNAGWKAMDERPIRTSAGHGVHDEAASQGEVDPRSS